jgi:hypothetical protein
MYTGGVVRHRFFAFVVALLIAVTPVIGAVCEMDCAQPPAASTPCHQANVPHEGTTLRGTSHGCDHDHTGGTPAMLTRAIGRDSVGPSCAVPLPAPVQARFSDIRTSAAAVTHDPPGLTCRSTSSYLTVLRI